MADKKFIGRVNEITFNNGGSMIKLTLSADDIDTLSSQINEKITIAIKKSMKGNWYAEIDSYVPATPEENTPVKPSKKVPAGNISQDQMPF